jgi:co-chaperonin GroES (HSP10)
MTADNWKPLANYLLVAVPERLEKPKGPRSPEGLGITLISGEDNMRELQAAIRAGGEIRIETASDTSDANKVRVGQVLQVPPRLDSSMVLCAGGPKGYRTLADVTPEVEVGDTVHLDPSCLIDENEIMPGVYRVPYSAVICVITPVRNSFINNVPIDNFLTPIGGYALLSRVWADDVTDETDAEGGLVKCRKKDGLVVETAVPPLADEGVVAWVGTPLRGTLPEIQPGQRVVIKPGLALVERIAGAEYLCVRQDYVLAVREPDFAKVPSEWTRADTDAFELVAPTLPADKFIHFETGAQSLRANLSDIKREVDFRASHFRPAHQIPAHHPAYNA